MKGYCSRGNRCQFEHGQESIFIPSQTMHDEYSPIDANISRPPFPASGNGRTGPVHDSAFSNKRGFGRGDPNRGGAGNRSAPRRNGRSEFSADRPSLDKTNTSLVVENIPQQNFTTDQIKEFFSEFGQVLDITLKDGRNLATIKFASWDAAKAAHASPKVIFDNRFVKVYWHQDTKTQIRSSSKQQNDETQMQIDSAEEADNSVLDMEQFTLKQQEAQKAHEEKAKKLQDMETARKEVEEKLSAQTAEKKKLLDLLAAKTTKTSHEATVTNAESQDKPKAQTEALKAQLAALQAEADSLGIDTTMNDDNNAWSSSRGRGRGRGQGFDRGRASFRARGSYGAYRGRGGASFHSGYNLDNRTKKVALNGVDFTDPKKDETLRQYLLVGYHYVGHI